MLVLMVIPVEPFGHLFPHLRSYNHVRRNFSRSTREVTPFGWPKNTTRLKKSEETSEPRIHMGVKAFSENQARLEGRGKGYMNGIIKQRRSKNTDLRPGSRVRRALLSIKADIHASLSKAYCKKFLLAQNNGGILNSTSTPVSVRKTNFKREKSFKPAWFRILNSSDVTLFDFGNHTLLSSINVELATVKIRNKYSKIIYV